MLHLGARFRDSVALFSARGAGTALCLATSVVLFAACSVGVALGPCLAAYR